MATKKPLSREKALLAVLKAELAEHVPVHVGRARLHGQKLSDCLRIDLDGVRALRVSVYMNRIFVTYSDGGPQYLDRADWPADPSRLDEIRDWILKFRTTYRDPSCT